MSVRLNIGCGMTPTDGWINYDNSVSLRLAKFLPVARIAAKVGVLAPSQLAFIEFCRANRLRFADARRRIPHKDNSVDVAYASHMFEHFDTAEAAAFLKETLRVLAPGGVLRLAVPDLTIRLNAYHRDGDADEFVRSLWVCTDRPRGLRRLHSILIGPRHHLWVYDARSLTRLLTAHGFVAARALPAGETMIKDPGDLDLRERDDESLYVEAIKPAAPAAVAPLAVAA